MFTQFYNESLRKLVIGFGSLFNDIRVIRKNPDGSTKETIRVPISYGPKEKFLRRIQEESSISDTSKIQMSLPRMGFDITGLGYDNTRKTNKLIKRKDVPVAGVTAGWNYNEVPYNVSFSLNIFTRNHDDNLQIVEQILPYFNPEFIVTMKVNSINDKVDIPISLANVSMMEEYEGDFDSRRNITSSLDFVAKSFVYGPAKTSKIILTSELDIHGVTGDVFDATISRAQELRVGITGGYTGSGYTAGNQIYGEYYYE